MDFSKYSLSFIFYIQYAISYIVIAYSQNLQNANKLCSFSLFYNAIRFSSIVIAIIYLYKKQHKKTAEIRRFYFYDYSSILFAAYFLPIRGTKMMYNKAAIPPMIYATVKGNPKPMELFNKKDVMINR